MSRIGKLPVNLPAGVTVEVSADNVVSVKGPLGTLSQKVDSDIKVEVGTHTDVHTGKEVPAVLVTRPTNQPRHRSLHGLYRALINNMVVGVTTGFSKSLEIAGVGYRAAKQGNNINFTLGFSHPVVKEPPAGITFEVPAPNKIVVSGADKEKVGAVAAEIRTLRPPEPYKGKGIRYEGEYVRRKMGKAGAKGKK
mgnify:CR=1 FL=1